MNLAKTLHKNRGISAKYGFNIQFVNEYGPVYSSLAHETFSPSSDSAGRLENFLALLG